MEELSEREELSDNQCYVSVECISLEINGQLFTGVF